MLASIECAQKLLQFRTKFDVLQKLLQGPIALRLREMKGDSGQELVFHLYEQYGKKEALKKITDFIEELVSARKTMFELQEKLPFLGVVQDEFDTLVHEIDLVLKHVDTVNSAQIFNEVNRVMNGQVSEPTLFGIMRGDIPLLDEVINFSDKYGFIRALERLGHLHEDMEQVIKKLSDCHGSSCDNFRSKVRKIQKNIQTVSQLIKEDERFEKQSETFLRETKVATERKDAINKSISLKNEKKELQCKIQEKKAEQKQYERERKQFERDKVDFECKLEQQKTKTYNAKLLFDKQKVATKVATSEALLREVQALKEKEVIVQSMKDAHIKMSEEQKRVLEAKKKLEEQKEKTAAAAQLGQKEKEQLREVVNVVNGYTTKIRNQDRQLKEIKKQVEENKKMVGGLSQSMNQANNPSQNPDYKK